MKKLKIVALCGSLREKSLNRYLLRLAGQVAPEAMEFVDVEWRAVPIFDADQLAKGIPDAVKAVSDSLRSADGLLIATPEYNFSVPGGLKNVIDWISREENQPFSNLPVALLSASQGPLGGARVQYDLRKIMLFVNGMVMVKPEVFVGGAAGKFDAEGACTDEATRKFVTAQMAAFERWIAGVAAMKAA